MMTRFRENRQKTVFYILTEMYPGFILVPYSDCNHCFKFPELCGQFQMNPPKLCSTNFVNLQPNLNNNNNYNAES